MEVQHEGADIESGDVCEDALIFGGPVIAHAHAAEEQEGFADQAGGEHEGTDVLDRTQGLAEGDEGPAHFVDGIGGEAVNLPGEGPIGGEAELERSQLGGSPAGVEAVGEGVGVGGRGAARILRFLSVERGLGEGGLHGGLRRKGCTLSIEHMFWDVNLI